MRGVEGHEAGAEGRGLLVARGAADRAFYAGC